MIVWLRRMRMPVVCSLLGVKARGLARNRKSEATNHLIENVIGLVAQSIYRNLKRHVTVAEVIASPGKQ